MSAEYHKIDTIYARDQRGRILTDQYSRPEFGYLADNEWLFTEKVDGTNIRLSYDGTGHYLTDTHAYIAGRTDNAQLPPHLLAMLVSLLRGLPLHEVFGADVSDVTIYGEGYGARVQKGGGNYIPDGCGFVLFDIKIGQWWLRWGDVEDIGGKLGLDVVPLVGNGALYDAVELARKGFASHRWLGVSLAEGLVCRPAVELFDRAGRRIITKIKHKDFQFPSNPGRRDK